jgi:hypothetical protein
MMTTLAASNRSAQIQLRQPQSPDRRSWRNFNAAPCRPLRRICVFAWEIIVHVVPAQARPGCFDGIVEASAAVASAFGAFPAGSLRTPPASGGESDRPPEGRHDALQRARSVIAPATACATIATRRVELSGPIGEKPLAFDDGPPDAGTPVVHGPHPVPSSPACRKFYVSRRSHH